MIIFKNLGLVISRFSTLFLTFSVLTLIVCSCGDDCVQSDFIGTYIGSSECNAGTTLDSDTFIIAAGSNEDQINISEIAGPVGTATINGCDFSIEGLTDGSSFTGSIDGNVMSFTINDNSTDTFCTFTGTK